MSTFFGLNIARLGMQAQQKALEVTAHNIANANTPGYSRQVAHMSPTTALPYLPKGMLGTGVRVDNIARVRDLFLERQIRHETHILGKWEARSTYLSQIEYIFLEPSENGFNHVLGVFFDSWQELSLNPESSAARTALIENSNLLLNAIKQTYKHLETVRDDITAHIELKVAEINSLAEQIKDLNIQITSLTVRNNQPSDLMDRRDLLLEQLAKIINFDVSYSENGAVNVLISGRPLVFENTVYELATEPMSAEEKAEIPYFNTDPPWPPAPKIVWAKDKTPIANNNKDLDGELGGLLELRDQELRQYMQDFESLVWGIVNAVNAQHAKGLDLTGDTDNNTETANFFIGENLLTLSVNEKIVENPSYIRAASRPDTGDDYYRPGDGNNAVKIAQLRNVIFKVNPLDADNPGEFLKNRLVIPGEDEEGSTTLEFFYRDIISRLGVDTQESVRMQENQNSLLELMTNRRTSISGVSLDEEMANMVQFQLAYQASARFLASLNEVYNTLINGILR
ncbi:MAG: flagellar hook-associated protein FlgK [Firmicutes bacterium]|nr:flagellar hook-associated protein FlgK [Bacillota bacterium]